MEACDYSTNASWTPLVEFSVTMLSPDEYQMGSRIPCRNGTDEIPSTAVTFWENYDGHYYLLKATDTIALSSQQPANGLICQAGVSSAVWEIGTIGEKFHFYRADLGPTNTLILDDGTITAILDWDSAGFYPKFWIPLKLYRSEGFNLDAPDDSRYKWTDILKLQFANVGFPFDHDHVMWQKALDSTFFKLGELDDDVNNL